MTAPATASADFTVSQEAAATLVAELVKRAWPRLDIANLDRSLPRFKLVMGAIVEQLGPYIASEAMAWYRQQRMAAGVAGALTLAPAAVPDMQRVGKGVDWATRQLWSRDPDVTVARKQVAATVERYVLDTGRSTIIDAVHRDPQAKACARVPETNPCSFCALLATRGAVYKQHTVGFKAHDNCRCHPEPVFSVYEPSAQIREWQALYAKNGGLNGFRRAYEGRA